MAAEEKAEGKQNTPDLDRLMTEGRPVFSGHGEPAADLSGPVDMAGHPAQEPPAAGTPPSDTPAAPSPAVASQEPDGKGKEAPRDDYRFKSLEEADKSYRLLQGEKTRTEQKLKVLETELAGKKEAAAREEAVKAENVGFVEFATKRNKLALTEINALEPDDPEYTDKAAACWAKANLEIYRWKPAAPSAAAEDGAPADRMKPAEKEEKPDAGPFGDVSDPLLSTRVFIESVLEGADLGIPKDDPVFWDFAKESPAVTPDGKAIPLKDQIWWAVEKTLLSRKAPETPGAAPKESPPADPRPENHPAQPMGRSGAFRPAGSGPAVTGPVSLADTLEQVQEMRRL